MVTMRDGIVDDVRIGLGAVAPKPWRARAAEDVLRGRAPDARAVGEDDAQSVPSRARRRHVEGLHLEPRVVLRPARRELGVADPHAVEKRLERCDAALCRLSRRGLSGGEQQKCETNR